MSIKSIEWMLDLHKRLLEKGIILLREEDYNYFSNKLITMKEAKE